MSTPDPALVAASPVLKTALTELKTCINTILTGDPAQIALRAQPAVNIFLSQLVLLLPSLASAEVGVMQTSINSQIDGLISKLP